MAKLGIVGLLVLGCYWRCQAAVRQDLYLFEDSRKMPSSELVRLILEDRKQEILKNCVVIQNGIIVKTVDATTFFENFNIQPYIRDVENKDAMYEVSKSTQNGQAFVIQTSTNGGDARAVAEVFVYDAELREFVLEFEVGREAPTRKERRSRQSMTERALKNMGSRPRENRSRSGTRKSSRENRSRRSRSRRPRSRPFQQDLYLCTDEHECPSMKSLREELSRRRGGLFRDLVATSDGDVSGIVDVSKYFSKFEMQRARRGGSSGKALHSAENTINSGCAFQIRYLGDLRSKGSFNIEMFIFDADAEAFRKEFVVSGSSSRQAPEECGDGDDCLDGFSGIHAFKSWNKKIASTLFRKRKRLRRSASSFENNYAREATRNPISPWFRQELFELSIVPENFVSIMEAIRNDKTIWDDALTTSDGEITKTPDLKPFFEEYGVLREQRDVRPNHPLYKVSGFTRTGQAFVVQYIGQGWKLIRVRDHDESGKSSPVQNRRIHASPGTADDFEIEIYYYTEKTRGFELGVTLQGRAPVTWKKPEDPPIYEFGDVLKEVYYIRDTERADAETVRERLRDKLDEFIVAASVAPTGKILSTLDAGQYFPGARMVRTGEYVKESHVIRAPKGSKTGQVFVVEHTGIPGAYPLVGVTISLYDEEAKGFKEEFMAVENHDSAGPHSQKHLPAPV